MPKRPLAWVAPGPAPAGALGRPELEPMEDETLSYLCGDWRIFQKRRGHRWSLDDLVTAWVASVEVTGPVHRAFDLGCGLGSVLMMVAFKWPASQLRGIEAQPGRAAMARRSLAFNGLAERCEIATGDFRTALSNARGGFDLVTGTPPYFPTGAGTESAVDHIAPCRFEHRGGVEAYVETAQALMAEEGRFVMCASMLEQTRIDSASAAAGLKQVTRYEVVPLEGKAPLISVTVFARHWAEPVRHRQLLVRDSTHQWSAGFLKVRHEMGLPPPSFETRGA